MKSFKDKLAWLETRLQAMVEGSAARILPGRQPLDDLGTQIVDALRRQTVLDADGSALAPDVLVLYVHPEMAEVLKKNRALLDELAQTLLETGPEMGLHFSSAPVIQVSAEGDLATGQVRVEAAFSQETLGETAAVDIQKSFSSASLPENAYLVVDGTKVFPLTQGVTNVGRGADNQLVLDLPQVSRQHAQVRLVRGHFVIFDLNSRSGTWVNGKRIQQCALYPGDVITLGGLPLVYGQDQPQEGETQDIRLPPVEPA